MPTVSELGRKIKEKHPQYADMPDEVLGLKIQAKYPGAYDDFSPAGMVTAPQPKGITGAPWGTFSSGPHMSFEETVGPDSMLGKAAGAIRGVSSYLPDEPLSLAVPRGTQVSTFLERARNVGTTLGAAYGTTKAGEAAGLSNGWAEAIGFATGALVGTKLSPEAMALLKKHGGPKGLLLDLLHGKSAAPEAAVPTPPKPFIGFPSRTPEWMQKQPKTPPIKLLERGPLVTPPPVDTSGPIPNAPPNLRGYPASVNMRLLEAPTSIPQGGFATGTTNDLVPVTHPVTKQIEYVPKWTLQGESAYTPEPIPLPAVQPARPAPEARVPIWKQQPQPPTEPAAVSPVNPVAGPKQVQVPPVPTAASQDILSGAPPLPAEHIPVPHKMKPVIDYSHEVRTGKNLGMANYFHKAKITTADIAAMTEAEYNKHIKLAGYRPSTGKGYSRPHSEAKAAVIEAIRKLREE